MSALAGLILWWAVGPSGSRRPDGQLTHTASRKATAAAIPTQPFFSTPPDALKNSDTREMNSDFHRIRDAAAWELRERIPGVRIDFDAITGGPKNIMAVGKFLESGQGAEAVSRFVDLHRELFGHGSEWLAAGNSRITRDDTSPNNGMKTLVWQQELDGIPFFQTTLRANLTKDGDLIAIGGNYLAVPQSAAGLSAAANPLLDVTLAIVIAAAEIGTQVDRLSIAITEGPQGIEQKLQFSAPGLSDTRASLTWVPMSPDKARLAWDVTLMSLQRSEMFRVLVDVETGEVIVRLALTNYISEATYRVHASAATGRPHDSPTPFSPGHAAPAATQPAGVSRELVTLDALDRTASPNGWIDDGGTSTIGNNVAAHTDSDASPNVPDLPRPTSATRTFDFPLSPTSPPSAYKDAAVTQLFYLNNWIHDKLYGLGFTESAGNFQTNNFSRGGLGNDAVLADAQDSSGTNNANFSTPQDGAPGRMQMYVFTGPTPDIDGDLDAEIVIHEYVHGLTNRLVGGGAGISAIQTQGLGEGWSDFYALALLSDPGDDLQGTYPLGGYVARQFSGLAQNYYFGIRRYPYSTNLLKNPLTFKDIDPSQAGSHAGIPRSPIIGGSANGVHNQGEVWGVTLWELRANLIAKYGFEIGNPLALQLVTDAMKLSPVNPDFIQARDAILQADVVNHSGANRDELWAAFAKRGMGASASSPSSSTTVGLVEAYDLPDDLEVTPLGSFAASGQVGGAITPAERQFTLRNNGAASLDWTANKTQSWLVLSAAAGTLAPGESAVVTASFHASSGSLPYGIHTDTITFTNSSSASNLIRPVELTVEPLYQTAFFESFESGALCSAWTITGTGNHRTRVTTTNDPFSGNHHLTMDSSVDDSYSRNEATLTLDLTGRRNLMLGFQVKMFNDEPHAPDSNPFTGGADFDGVAISSDGGTTWHEILALRSISNSWEKITVDLDAALATRGLAYTSNFKIRFNHYDNFSIGTDGFALDDILVAEPISNLLTLTTSDSATEGDASISAVLSVTPVPVTDLAISLTASNSEATVPASVVIPAGSASVAFSISPQDDALLDGSQPVIITATASGFPTVTKQFVVHDNETASLALDLPDSLIEGSSPSTGWVTTSAPVDADVEVALYSESPSLWIPPFVTLPAGASSAQFTISPINDSEINGSREVIVQASVIGWIAGADTLTLLDDETSVLTVTVPAMREGDAGVFGTVAISGTLAGDLTVALATDDSTELTVPASVTIPAGQMSASFPLGIQDDSETDGSQPVTLSATAAGFPDASAIGRVADNDAHHFTLAAMPATVLRNAPVAVTIVAKDIDDATITNFSGTLAFTAADSFQAEIAVTPTSAESFLNGILTTDLAFGDFGTGVVLTVGGNGVGGSSSAFDIVSGPLNRFVWDTVPSVQHVDAPFQATLRALDEAGNHVTSFAGPLNLSAITTGTVEILTWTAYADMAENGEYVQSKQAIASHFTNFNESTTTTSSAATLAELLVGKQVFLIVEQEGGNATLLGSIGTAWTGVLGDFVAAGGIVIACSNTNFEHLLLANSGLLDLSPLSSPSSMNVTKSADTPLNAGVATPFTGAYLHTYTSTNGTTDLQTTDGEAVVISRSIGAGRVVMIGTDFYTLGTEMDLVIANAVALQSSTATLPVHPGVTGNFTNGEWTGEISIPYSSGALNLRATDGTKSAESNSIAVLEPQLTPGIPPPDRLTLTLPPQVQEGAGTVSGSVSLASVLPNDLTVDLISKSPAKISLPATVIIPAGLTTAEVPLTVPDDGFVDGLKSVIITAYAAGYPLVETTVQVKDDDGGSLTLTLPASIQETAGSVNGTVLLSTPALTPLLIPLASDLTIASPQATVTLPRGATTAEFMIAITDNGIVEGNQIVNLTANLEGWTSATASLLVLDDESRNLAITLPVHFREGDGPKSGLVSLGGTAAADVSVNLTSSTPAEISVPAAVTILAGQHSAPFTITVVDDMLADGPQPFTLTAAADTFISAEAVGVVRDNDAHHFTFAPFGSPMLKNGPVPAVITARDAEGLPIHDYDSPISLSATGDSGPLAVSPSAGTGFIHGTWSGSVRIYALAANVILTVSDGFDHEGSSNAFDLIEGTIDRFEWDSISSPQTLDTPFFATVRAVDAEGTTATGYNGIANLTMLASTANPAIGTGGGSTPYGIATTAHDSRSNLLFTADELGGAARITALSFNITAIHSSGQTLTNWTVRLKHTPLANLAAPPAWDNDGWTTVYQGNPVITTTGWVTFPFTTPFDHDGTDNLLLDFSMDRTASGLATYVESTPTTHPFAVYGASNSLHGDPLAWTGSTPIRNSSYQRPDIRFSTVKELSIRPRQTGVFSNGVWTGEVSVPLAQDGLTLKATAGGITGSGNPFDVTGPAPPSGEGAIVFSEDFESSFLNPEWWLSTGTGNFRTRVTSQYSPHGGTQHLAMDSTSGAARNEATLTLDLSGRSGVVLKFWAAGYNEEAHGPPPSPFTGGADFDGVAISADGTTWWEVQSLRSLPGSYGEYSVSLDPVISAHGLAYGPGFKIRFNQFDDNSLTTDGIVIDDILVTATPVSGFILLAPSQVTEGNPATATVELNAPALTDTIIALRSSAPAKLSVPPSVTVTAGQTGTAFPLTLPDDGIADGNRTVTVTGTAPGMSPFHAQVLVIDDEILPLSLTGPATLTEGDAGQTGTLTLGTPASGKVTVHLTSSDTEQLAVPTSIDFAPGQTAANFPVTVIDDTRIDGDREVTVTASVSGWREAEITIEVADDETRVLSISQLPPIFEGASASGTVSITGTLPENLRITLTSSDPSQFSVPTSVTIPAGQTSVRFTGTAVDDDATDGTQSATITASSASFISASKIAYAFDNDVHHFSFSTIESSRKTGVPFSVTASARDVNDVVITPYAGSIILTAAGDGGPVALIPETSVSFGGGSWSGFVTLSTADTNVRLKATGGDVSGTSNAFDVESSPAIALTPAEISLALPQGESATRTLSVTNTGGGTLTWSMVSNASLGGGSGTSSASAIDVGLARILANLNTNHGLVRAVIPNRFAFTDGVYGSSINDGGNDMFDTGNILNTNLGSSLAYTDNLIIPSVTLGAGGQYFTRKFEGLWVFAADISDLEFFEITGNLGADGGGTVDTTILTDVRNGITYRGFVKRVFNAGDPSVNHLMIIEDNGIAFHTASTDTNDGQHRLSGLTGVTRIYHLLFAGTGGAYINDTAAGLIMTEFLDAISMPDWISSETSSGSVTAGSVQDLSLEINTADLTYGTFKRTLVISSNDPANPQIGIPITLTVIVAPDMPILASEPPFTPGTTNTVTWTSVPAAHFYQIQAATDPDFHDLVADIPVTATARILDALTDGTLYQFRVRAAIETSGNPVYSPWSSSESSTQDASPPVILRETSAISESAIIIPGGRAIDAGAGVASVTVNGKPAILAPDRQNWSAPPLLLLPGENEISVTASDTLDPANSRTDSWTVIYTGPPTTDADGDSLPDDWESSHGLNPADNGGYDPLQGAGGDPDGDSISNLLEYALGLDPSTHNTSGLPTGGLEVAVADGKIYQIFRYRRRIQRNELLYQVETFASDTSHWDGSGEGLEEISTQPTGDGITELVTVRIAPAIDIAPRRFARLKITAD